MHVSDLPVEIIVEIFTYLPQPYIVSTIKDVCLRWKGLAFAPKLWRSMDLYHKGPFLRLPNEELNALLRHVGSLVIKLRTKACFVFEKFDPKMFTNLKALHLRMFDEDQNEKLQRILEQFTDLETFMLDVTKYDKLSEMISICKRLKNLRKFQLRHFFCNHSTKLKLMPHVLQTLFLNTPYLNHVVVCCGDIFLDTAIQTLLLRNSGLLELNLNRSTGITNMAFSQMQSCKIRSLSLNRTTIDDEALKTIAENSPFLRNLSVSKCESVTDLGIKYISEKCKMLEYLQINDFTQSNCCQVTNRGILDIAEGCRKLCTLNANQHPLIDGTSLTAIAFALSNIKTLKLENVAKINDAFLTAFAMNCKFLESVNFSGCTEITDMGVSNLLTRCKWLKHASFIGCENIHEITLPTGNSPIVQRKNGVGLKSEDCSSSLGGILRKSDDHSHIQTLLLTNCDNLSVQSLINISGFCPDLHEIRITAWSNEDMDLAVISILQGCNNLQVFMLNGREGRDETNFTNKSLDAMVEFGHNLKRVHLSLNYKLTSDAFGKFLLGCKKLEFVDLYVDDDTLTLEDVEQIVMSSDPEKIACQSYKGLSRTCCYVTLQKP